MAEFKLLHSPFVPLTDAEGQSLSRIRPYPPMLDPCRLCPARCCHTTVKATLPDLIRYAQTLTLPVWAGFTLVPSLDERRGFPVARDPRFVDDEDGWPDRAEVSIRRKPGGGCIHLLELDGFQRCGVYGARPGNCRLYPVSWEDEQGRGGPDAVMCPAPFAVTPAVGAQAEADARELRAAWAVHEAVVQAFSGEVEAAGTLPDPDEALLRLLSATAAALEVPLPAVLAQEGTAVERLDRELQDLGIMPSR